MRNLILSKEVLATLSALKPGRRVTVKLIDRDTDPEHGRDMPILLEAMGIPGGIALLEPTQEQARAALESGEAGICRDCPSGLRPCKACFVKAGYDPATYDARFGKNKPA